MTLNPVKVYRNWLKRRDIKLRHQAMVFATKMGGSCEEVLGRAHIYFLYLKYGIAKDGVSLNGIFKIDEDANEHKYPEGPVRLT